MDRACISDGEKNTYSILMGKQEEKRCLGRLRRKLDNVILMSMCEFLK
jgi:hypothetical protein